MTRRISENPGNPGNLRQMSRRRLWDQVNAKHGTGIVKTIPQIGVYKVRLPAGVTAEEMAGRYRLEPGDRVRRAQLYDVRGCDAE